MDWKIGQPNPDWYFLRHVHFCVKVWGPSVEIQALRAHEIWSISEYQISVFFGNKLKDEESTPYWIAGHTILELGAPVPLDPVVRGFG